MSWPQARRVCLDLCMSTHTGMDYWLDLEIEELLEHQKDVDKLIEQSKKNG